jgi:hypothetical protein
MRSILVAALVLELGFGLSGGAAALAATAGPPSIAGTMPPAQGQDAVAPPGRVDPTAGPARPQAGLAWRIVRRQPGFVTLDDAAPEAEQGASDPPPTVLRGAEAAPSSAQSGCMRRPMPVVVGGQVLTAMMVGCPQADGSWEVTQYTPGLPPQVYTLPGPPPAPAAAQPPAAASATDYGEAEDYAYDYPYWAGAPWFFGFVPGIAGRESHGFHRRFGRGFRPAVARLSEHGLGRGSAPGFGRGEPFHSAAGMHR